MPFFSILLYKMIPFYFFILLGVIAGKKLQINGDPIAKIMFYLINPLIIFNGVLNAKIDGTILALPVLTFLVSSSVSILFYQLSKRIWTDSSKNIMAFSAGSGNTGYFGLPIAMLVLSPQAESYYIMALLGVTIYENSIGYYISAKGSNTTKECLAKLLRLPSIYVLILGMLINFLRLPVPDIFKDSIVHIKGVYVVLGMMLLGLGLSGLKGFSLDYKFIGMTFLAKFVVWPGIMLSLVACDCKFFGLYTPIIHSTLIFLSIVPLAVNTVVMSSLMQANPERSAATVFLSTLFALVYIPFMTSLFIETLPL